MRYKLVKTLIFYYNRFNFAFTPVGPSFSPAFKVLSFNEDEAFNVEYQWYSGIKTKFKCIAS